MACMGKYFCINKKAEENVNKNMRWKEERGRVEREASAKAVQGAREVSSSTGDYARSLCSLLLFLTFCFEEICLRK